MFNPQSLMDLFSFPFWNCQLSIFGSYQYENLKLVAKKFASWPSSILVAKANHFFKLGSRMAFIHMFYSVSKCLTQCPAVTGVPFSPLLFFLLHNLTESLLFCGIYVKFIIQYIQQILIPSLII
jgi:hypothetical protein